MYKWDLESWYFMSSPVTTVEHARFFTQKNKSPDLYSWWVFNKMGGEAFSKTPLTCKFIGLLMFSINCRVLAYNHQLDLVLLIKSRTAFSLPAEQGKLHAVPVSFYLGLQVSSGLKLSEQSALFILWFFNTKHNIVASEMAGFQCVS